MTCAMKQRLVKLIPLHFQTRGSQRAAKTLLCAVEKEKLREEIKPFKQNLADYAASQEVSEASGGSGAAYDEPLGYGKVPRHAALNRKWEEIGN